MANKTIEEKMKNAKILIFSDKFAVALMYEKIVDSAPILVCKSKNIQNCIEIAKKLNISIFEDSIANDIAHLVKINNKILPSMYKRIATILTKIIKRTAIEQRIGNIDTDAALSLVEVNEFPSMYKSIDKILRMITYFHDILSTEQPQEEIPNCISSEELEILLMRRKHDKDILIEKFFNNGIDGNLQNYKMIDDFLERMLEIGLLNTNYDINTRDLTREQFFELLNSLDSRELDLFNIIVKEEEIEKIDYD